MYRAANIMFFAQTKTKQKPKQNKLCANQDKKTLQN